MRLHASVLDLLSKTIFPLPSPSPSVSALLVEPFSRSVALCLSDSSYLLFPSFSSSTSKAPSPPPKAVPPDTIAAAFLRLLPSGDVLFITAAPVAVGGALVFRAWILLLNPPRFEPTCLAYKRNSPATLPLAHGLGVRLAMTVNYFAVYAPSAGQIWVMGAKVEGVAKENLTVDLVKCAVVVCDLPIYSIGMSMGFMVLGEVGGIRVFSVRQLVKGNGAKSKMKGPLHAGMMGGERLLGSKKGVIPNGFAVCRSASVGGAAEAEGTVEEKADGKHVLCKLMCARLKQSSGDFGSFFMDIKFKNVVTESIAGVQASVKAISIQLLSQKQFLILDSAGDLHLLSLGGTSTASEITVDPSRSSKYACTNILDLSMKVQTLAVLPSPTRAEFVCISDGEHSVHLMSVDNEHPAAKDDDEENEKLAVFSGSAHDRSFGYRNSSPWSRKDICIFHILMISKSWLITLWKSLLNCLFCPAGSPENRLAFLAN